MLDSRHEPSHEEQLGEEVIVRAVIDAVPVLLLHPPYVWSVKARIKAMASYLCGLLVEIAQLHQLCQLLVVENLGFHWR